MLGKVRDQHGRYVKGHAPTTKPAWYTHHTCPSCKTSFLVDCHQPNQKYCSRPCMAKGYRNAPREQHLISRICFGCGQKYETWPSQNKRYCSFKCRRGNKHPMWRGGNSRTYRTLYSTAIHKSWRTSVFARDDYTCQRCGERGGKLEAHHDLPFAYYPALRYELLNGATLCQACHNRTKISFKKMQIVWF